MIMKTVIKAGMISLFFAAVTYSGGLSDGPYQATGIKIGEVTYNTAIVWTRLTRHPDRVGFGAPMPEISYRNPKTGKIVKENQGRPNLVPIVNFPKNSTIETIEGAVPGTTGRVRVLYKIDSASDWLMTDWEAVDPNRDYTHQFVLTGLKPDSKYQVRAESREIANGKNGQTVEGGFRTAPSADRSQRVVFTVTTGQAYPDQDAPGGGYKMYPAMLKLDPDFFVHTGDIVYYDMLAKSLPLARWHWARMYSLPTNVEFHRQVASYFIKDDHDTWMDDCWPGMETRFMGDFTFEQGPSDMASRGS
jgi:alkaline phosphatase D